MSASGRAPPLLPLLLCCLLALPGSVVGGSSGEAREASPYAWKEQYVGEDFFSKFTFWEDADPTKGYVDYVGEAEAQQGGLIKASSNRAYMAADSKHKTGKDGRPSIRIQSKAMYNKGLFIADIDHIPTGCGTWPAFWMYGEDAQHIWPRWGEYDIIEGVHHTSKSSTTLHTTRDCDQQSVDVGDDFASRWNAAAAPGQSADNCNVDATGQWHNQGCSQKGPTDSMGPGFNKKGGGVFAAEWDPLDGAKHFRTWFWPSGSEPPDVKAKAPKPHTWGMPFSYFSLAKRVCTPDHFKNMRLVFDLTFCGDLGDAMWGIDCPEAGQTTCSKFVANNPGNMTEAYWSIRSLDVFQREEEQAPATAAPKPSPHPTAVPVPPPGPAKPEPAATSTTHPPSAATTTAQHAEPAPATTTSKSTWTWPPVRTSAPPFITPTQPAEISIRAESRGKSSTEWLGQLAAGVVAVSVVGAVAMYLNRRRIPGFSRAGRSSSRRCMSDVPFCDGASDISSVASSAPGSPNIHVTQPPAPDRYPRELSLHDSSRHNGGGERSASVAVDRLSRSAPAHVVPRQYSVEDGRPGSMTPQAAAAPTINFGHGSPQQQGSQQGSPPPPGSRPGSAQLPVPRQGQGSGAAAGGRRQPHVYDAPPSAAQQGGGEGHGGNGRSRAKSLPNDGYTQHGSNSSNWQQNQHQWLQQQQQQHQHQQQNRHQWLQQQQHQHQQQQGPMSPMVGQQSPRQTQYPQQQQQQQQQQQGQRWQPPPPPPPPMRRQQQDQQQQQHSQPQSQGHLTLPIGQRQSPSHARSPSGGASAMWPQGGGAGASPAATATAVHPMWPQGSGASPATGGNPMGTVAAFPQQRGH